MPFLRPIDVPADADDPLVAVYREVIAAARARRRTDQALVVLGHLYVQGAEVSQLSERRIAIGGVEAVSARLFPDDIDYVALGHMHRAQRVGRDHVRYAGAPIPLALDEAHYVHSIVIVDFADGRVADLRLLRIPKLVEVLQIAGELERVLAEIAALPALGDPADPTGRTSRSSSASRGPSRGCAR